MMNKKTHVLVCSFVPILLSLGTLSLPQQDQEGHLVTIRLVREESNPDARVRREADSNMPDKLTLQIPTEQDQVVTLNAGRVKLLSMVTRGSNVTAPYSQNVAVYTDIDHSASMIVRRAEGQYTLTGSFVHSGKEWHVSPADRSKRQAGGIKLHRLVSGKPAAKTVNFNGDTFHTDEPHVEVLSLEERNRYRLQRLARLRGEGDNLNQRAVTGRDTKRENPHRFKRNAVTHIVEMAFVVDYKDYERFISMHGSSDATSEATVWYTFVAEGIDMRYRTISDFDVVVGTKVTHFRLLTTDAEDDFIEDLTSGSTFDGGAGLNAFMDWVQTPSSNIPNADHYMYFTGFDISGAVGVAYLSRVCTASGVSITENDFTGFTAEVAAHELGHSLSARHDGTQAGCSDSTLNVMNAISTIPIPSSARGNPWRFSTCSISSIKTYLGSVSCTEPGNTGSTDALPYPTGDDRAGIAKDRDDQCQQIGYTGYCSAAQDQNGGESNLCSGMFCTDPNDADAAECIAIIPLEYSSCGADMWCRLGNCMNNNEEPTNPPPATNQPPSPPRTIFDCLPFLLKLDFLGLIFCIRDVIFG